MTKRRQSSDLLEYGTALEQLRERRGLSREQMAERSGVSYSYLSEVERGLKRPSTDVLVKIATAMEMLPSDLLRAIEDISAKGHGLLRRRVYEAPMHEHPSPAPAPDLPRMEVARAMATESAPPTARGRAGRLLTELTGIAAALSEDDLEVLLRLAQRLRGA